MTLRNVSIKKHFISNETNSTDWESFLPSKITLQIQPLFQVMEDSTFKGVRRKIKWNIIATIFIMISNETLVCIHFTSIFIFKKKTDPLISWSVNRTEILCDPVKPRVEIYFSRETLVRLDYLSDILKASKTSVRALTSSTKSLKESWKEMKTKSNVQAFINSSIYWAKTRSPSLRMCHIYIQI